MYETFVHSGDIGDIIYALPTIKAKKGGHLVLTNTPGKTSHGMTEEKMLKLKPLLLAQNYIHSVTFDPKAKPTSVDGFRDHLGAGNLADMHLATQGLAWHARSKPWLTVDPIKKYEVIFTKTLRYNNPFFDWRNVYNTYKDKAIFLGLPEEHTIFEVNNGPIELVNTTCFLEIARLVAGCKLYVGNYTSITAIAEGLKHPQMIVEVFPKDHHLAIFQRFGCLLAWDHKIELPIL